MRHLVMIGRQLHEMMTRLRSQAMAAKVTMLLSPKNPTPIPSKLQPTINKQLKYLFNR